MTAFASTSNRAQKLEDEGDYEGAQKIYESILEKNPADKAILLKLAQVQYWRGDYPGAVKTYQTLLEKDSQNVEGLSGIGKTYLAMGKSKEARRYFNKAKEIDPNNREIEAMDPSNENKAKIRVEGGSIIEILNYAQDTQAEFQEIHIYKEKEFDFALNNTFWDRFGLKAFDTHIFGSYYFKEKTRIDLALSFSPSAIIVPRQSYSFGLAHTFEKVTPEIHYQFFDFRQANVHSLRVGLFFDPTIWLRLGGGYEFQSLQSLGTSQNFDNAFARARIGTPLDWLSFNAQYEYLQRGFEAGRALTPFFNYTAHRVGGDIRVDLVDSYSFHFGITHENRSNGERSETYLFSIGYSF